jgi:hypothetical protein
MAPDDSIAAGEMLECGWLFPDIKSEGMGHELVSNLVFSTYRVDNGSL